MANRLIRVLGPATIAWRAFTMICVPLFPITSPAAHGQLPELSHFARAIDSLTITGRPLSGRVVTELRQRLIRGAQKRMPAAERLVVGRAALIHIGAHPEWRDSIGNAVGGEGLFWHGAIARVLRGSLADTATVAWAVRLLDSLAPYPRLWASLETERTRVAEAQHRGATPSAGLDWLATLLELEAGNCAAAVEVGTRLMSYAGIVDGTSPARRAHAAAQVAFLCEPRRADSLYFHAASLIESPADVDWFRQDLWWIATDAELAAWEGLPSDETVRVAWLRAFWHRLDLVDAQPPGARLAEQFARWRLALRDFRWDVDGSEVAGIPAPSLVAQRVGLGGIGFYFRPGLNRNDPNYANRYQPLSHVLDDRGHLVMRHGPPEAMTIGSTGLEEVALYRWVTPGGDLVVGFSRPADPGGTSMRFGMLARNFPVGDLMVGCSLDSDLCVLAGLNAQQRGQPEFRAAFERAHLIYTEERERAETTQGNSIQFSHRLDGMVDLIGLPGGGGAITWAALVECSGDGACERVFRVRATVGDSGQGNVVAYTDTLVTWIGPRERAGLFMALGWAPIDLPRGTWYASIVLSEPVRNAGRGAQRPGVIVLDTLARRPAIGDVILGRPSATVTLPVGSMRAPVNPTWTWRTGDSVVVTVPVAGLEQGERYELQVEVWSGVANKAERRISIAAPIEATASNVVIQRTLFLAELPPARYEMRITLTGTGAVVSSARSLVVVK